MERGIACVKGASQKVNIEVGGYLLAAEAPGIGARAPNQYEILLASLGACTALTLRQFAASRHWPIESLDVYLELERDEEGMRVNRMLLVTGVDRECQEVLLDLARLTPLTRLLGAGMSIATILI